MIPSARSGGLSRGLLATARADNWWTSKLLPLLAVAFAQLLRNPAAPAVALPALAAVAVALCAVAWHAHVVNDLCDIEDDARSGKPNRMAGSSALRRWTLLVVLPLVGLLSAASPFIEQPMPAAVLAANFAVFAMYSVSPVRLKTRRWWGVVADASGAHALPTLFVLSAMPGGLERSVPGLVFAASAITCSFAVGLRGIIMHQFADRRADERAHLNTLGATSSLSTARALVQRVFLPIEAGALVLMVGLTAPYAPLLMLAAVLYVAVEVAKVRRAWTLPQFEPEGSREPYLPLVNNDVYELWLPNTLALQLAAGSYGFLLLPILLVALFGAGMRQRMDAISKLSRDRPDPQRFLTPRRGVRQAWAAAKARWAATGNDGLVLDTASVLRDASVIVGSPNWARNGVNLHSLQLVRGLTKRGINARLLLSEEETDLVTVDEPRLEDPSDVPMDRLPVGRTEGWGAHWGATVRYLEEHAPCVYLPTYDWRHACIVPRLSSRVQVVGDLIREDSVSDEQIRRLGAHMSAIVSHDAQTAASFQAAHPELADRLVVIPNGIEMQHEVPTASARQPVEAFLVSTSTFDGWEVDLPPILRAIAERGPTPRATLLGSADHPERGLPQVPGELADMVRTIGAPVPSSLLAEHSVILSWLSSEHAPTELVEAMGWGCIPFLIDCGNKTHALFRPGENCFVFERGDTRAIAQRLTDLESSPRLLEIMSAAAYRSAREHFISFDTELEHYLALFAAVVDPSRTAHLVRPVGIILPPPADVNGIGVFPVALNHHVAGVGRFPSVRDFEDFSRQVEHRVAKAPNGHNA